MSAKSRKNSERKIERKHHVRDYEMDDYIFVSTKTFHKTRLNL